MSDTDIVSVTFYFSSGLSLGTTFEKKDWELFLISLNKYGFKDASHTGEDFGINFCHVTHFLVKDK